MRTTNVSPGAAPSMKKGPTSPGHAQHWFPNRERLHAGGGCELDGLLRAISRAG